MAGVLTVHLLNTVFRLGMQRWGVSCSQLP